MRRDLDTLRAAEELSEPMRVADIDAAARAKELIEAGRIGRTASLRAIGRAEALSGG